jgi:hypothetical protein
VIDTEIVFRGILASHTLCILTPRLRDEDFNDEWLIAARGACEDIVDSCRPNATLVELFEDFDDG